MTPSTAPNSSHNGSVSHWRSSTAAVACQKEKKTFLRQVGLAFESFLSNSTPTPTNPLPSQLPDLQTPSRRSAGPDVCPSLLIKTHKTRY